MGGLEWKDDRRVGVAILYPIFSPMFISFLSNFYAIFAWRKPPPIQVPWICRPRNGQLLNELTSDHSSAREELDALQAGHLSWKTHSQVARLANLWALISSIMEPPYRSTCVVWWTCGHFPSWSLTDSAERMRVPNCARSTWPSFRTLQCFVAKRLKALEKTWGFNRLEKDEIRWNCTPWKINMEPRNHPFRKATVLPKLHEDMFHVNLQVFRDVRKIQRFGWNACLAHVSRTNVSPSLSPMRHEKNSKLMVYQGRWAIADVSRSASRSEKKKSKVFERQDMGDINEKKIFPPPPKKIEIMRSNIWVFPKIGVPQNGWFIMDNSIKMDDLGVPLFLETSTSQHQQGELPFKRLRHVFLAEALAALDGSQLQVAEAPRQNTVPWC